MARGAHRVRGAQAGIDQDVSASPSADRGQVLPPGSTVGVLGGGQLGRMTALAAARLGYRVHVYCPEPDSPAFHVAATSTVAPYEDRAALARFAEAVAGRRHGSRED